MSLGNFSNIGKILIFIGIGIAILGALIILFSKVPFFGKLPGDFSIKKDNFSFYFPLASSVIISIILTAVINIILFLVFRFRK